MQYCEDCQYFIPSEDIEYARCQKHLKGKEQDKMRISQSYKPKYQYCEILRTKDKCKDYRIS